VDLSNVCGKEKMVAGVFLVSLVRMDLMKHTGHDHVFRVHDVCLLLAGHGQDEGTYREN